MAEQKESISPSFRITYFPGDGRGAALRAAASFGGLSYEDQFTSFSEHKQAQDDGTRRWSGIPEITVFDENGTEVAVIGQSNSCLRYIGILSGLFPTKNVIERALVDEILDGIEEVNNMINASVKERDSQKKKAMRLKLMEADNIPYWLNKFEMRLEENGKRGNKNGYFVGDNLTVADLKFYFMNKGLTCGVLDYIDGAKMFQPFKRATSLCEQLKAMDKMNSLREN
eukprot:UN06719